MPSPRGTFRGRGSLRRKTAWSEGPGSGVVTAVSTIAAAFVGSSVALTVEGLTVIRIRGWLHAYLSSAGSALDGMAGAFGIGIATTAAVTAGIASVLTPITEQRSENWLYWTPIQLFCPNIGTATSKAIDVAAAGSGLLSVEVDMKAMRKFPDEMSIYAAVELSTEVGTAIVQVRFDSRLLAKLP